MPPFLVQWLVTTLTIVMMPYLKLGVTLKGSGPEGFGAALAMAAILGILNVLVKPILVLLTLPLTVVTLGLFLVVINGILFQVAGAFVRGIEIHSFWSALFASILVSIVSWVTNLSIDKRNGRRVVIVRGRRRY